MSRVPKWAKGFDRFPMRQQGELDGACGAYCIAAIATWRASRKDPGVIDPERKYNWWLGDMLGDDALRASVLDDRGLKQVARRALAKRLGLHLKQPVIRRTTQLRALVAKHGPVLATLRMTFRDPLGRCPPTTLPHSVVVLATDDEGLFVADPCPWNKRLSVMRWNDFRPVCWPKGQWLLETLSPLPEHPAHS